MEIFFRIPWITVGMAALVAFWVSYVSIPTVVNVAREKGLYDFPNGRTSHIRKTPTLGGIAIFSAFVISCLFFLPHSNLHEFQYVLLGVVIMFFVGLKDDILVLAPFKKLVAQIVAAVIIIDMAQLRFTSLHGFFGIYDISYHAGLYLTLFVVVVITNAFNLVDGIDGLASGLGSLSFLIFGMWFFMNGEIGWTVVCFSMMGALIAFFRFNVYSIDKKIFMGDTGSLIVGFVISAVVIKFNQYSLNSALPHPVFSSPAVSFGIIFIPLFDTLRVFILRMMNKKSPFSPDRRHLHHMLLDLKFKHVQASTILIGINAFMVLVSFMFQKSGILHLILYQFILGLAITCILYFLARRKSSIVQSGIQS